MRASHRQLKLFPDRVGPGPAPAFSVRRSTRAKRLTIKVYPGGRVEVVVPRRTAHRLICVNANVPNMLGKISEAFGQAGLNIHDMVNSSKGDKDPAAWQALTSGKASGFQQVTHEDYEAVLARS